jgi:hypothetical protein
MEVDSSAVEDRKESGGVAVSSEGESSHGGLSVSPKPEQHGQTRIWKGCPTLSKLDFVLMNAPVDTVAVCVFGSGAARCRAAH